MRKCILVLMVICLALSVTVVADAGHRSKTSVVAQEDNYNVAGAKLDAPNLVKFSENWTLGAEGGKDIVKNIFYDDNAYLEADKGYFAYIKVTYSGNIFDLTKKEE